MSIGDYFILVQNVFLIVLVTCPTWILCKGKKKNGGGQTPSKKGGPSSAESLQVKSAIKPPITDPSPSMLGPVKDEAKKEGSKASEGKPSEENKDAGGGGATGGATNEGPSDAKSKDISLKPFPKFEMPTESKKKKKLAEKEVDKKEKVKAGFYQEKSDEDDTLEKVDSLRVEQSDKTKRSQKKKK